MAEEAGASKKPKKYTGILLHPTSLPGPYGIGELGASAYRFVDFLERSGLNTWQVLPLGHTGFGDSPYQPFSAFAGQPLIISLDHLKELHLLYDEDFRDMPAWNAEQINYGELIEFKTGLLKLAYSRFHDESLSDGIHDDPEMKQAYDNFCETSVWLKDYALFMAGKDYHQGMPWYMWEDNLKKPTKKQKETWAKKLDTEMGYYKFIQFLFYYEWTTLKKYANDKGISIVGDIPIFMAWDSVDVWANQSLFQLDSKGYPTVVAGVPPDYFSATGQLWGNPLYDWPAHKATGFDWWKRRMKHATSIYDVVRIDHFRGFESYYSIPAENTTAAGGHWEKGPDRDFIHAMQQALGGGNIIAEDLGYLTPEVKAMLAESGYPGMKIMQFAFDSRESGNYLPHTYPRNSVVYTGTHDNVTTEGWRSNASAEDVAYACRYLRCTPEELTEGMICACLASVSDTAIIPLADWLHLGSEARINTPSTQGANWRWRLAQPLPATLAGHIAALTTLYERVPKAL